MDYRRGAVSFWGLSGLSMGFALPAKAVSDKFIASHDPALAKLDADRLARIHHKG